MTRQMSAEWPLVFIRHWQAIPIPNHLCGCNEGSWAEPGSAIPSWHGIDATGFTSANGMSVGTCLSQGGTGPAIYAQGKRIRPVKTATLSAFGCPDRPLLLGR
jgi:hypothetical protein